MKRSLTESAFLRVTFLNQALRLDPATREVRIALRAAHTELGEHQPALNVIDRGGHPA